MKWRNLASLAIVTTLLVTSFSVPTFAYETVCKETRTEQTKVTTPRYAYVSSAFLAVDPSSSEIAYEIMIDGILDVTSISGTLTLYKEGASGRFEKKASKSLRTSGEQLESYGTFASYGSGNYRLTFTGTVYANGGLEPITLSTEDSF